MQQPLPSNTVSSLDTSSAVNAPLNLSSSSLSSPSSSSSSSVLSLSMPLSTSPSVGTMGTTEWNLYFQNLYFENLQKFQIQNQMVSALSSMTFSPLSHQLISPLVAPSAVPMNMLPPPVVSQPSSSLPSGQTGESPPSFEELQRHPQYNQLYQQFLTFYENQQYQQRLFQQQQTERVMAMMFTQTTAFMGPTTGNGIGYPTMGHGYPTMGPGTGPRPMALGFTAPTPMTMMGVLSNPNREQKDESVFGSDSSDEDDIDQTASKANTYRRSKTVPRTGSAQNLSAMTSNTSFSSSSKTRSKDTKGRFKRKGWCVFFCLKSFSAHRCITTTIKEFISFQ